ncbi:MAG: hypothetical protein EA388_12175 [Nitriliruptor sp.]|nr:MAG: hypothetical protein EA388_12175 [Nitriliruptor sp.]
MQKRDVCRIEAARNRIQKEQHMRRSLGVVVLVAALVLSTMGGAFAQPAARGIEAGCPDSRVTSAGFTDTAGSAFATEINCVVWWQIASGRSPSTYGPDLSANRAQMATVFANLIRVTGGELPDNPPSAFADTAGSVHGPNIDALAAIGVVAGTSATTYRPSRPITREQMATFIFGTYEYLTGEELVGDQDYFGDDDGSIHENAINAIAQAGITGGDADGNYRPRGHVTRGAMAAFLARTLDLLVDAGFANPPVIPDAVLGYDIDRAASNSGFTSGSVGTCWRILSPGFLPRQETLDGTPYEQSLSCMISGESVAWNEYNLARQYGKFTATIGQGDNSTDTEGTVRFRVVGDGEVLFSQDLGFGTKEAIEVDVTGVLRLRIESVDISGAPFTSRWAVWGTPTVGG